MKAWAIALLNKKSQRNQDIVIVLLLLLMSFGVAYHYLSNTSQPQFYQKEFAPAVMQACGYGYIQPQAISPDLKQFLSLQTQSFDCSSLASSIKTSRLNIFQVEEHYLLSSVAFIWRILGVSWDSALYLNMLLFGLTIIGSYFIFRLGMNPLFSTLLSICLIYSGKHLSFLPHLRDYSIAPFALWFVWILGLVATKQYRYKKLLGMMVALGVILGVSFGFRSDLLIYLPIVLVTVLFFTATRTIQLKKKCMLMLTFLISFFLVMGPIFFPLLGTGSNLAHVTILGLLEPFSLQLGVGQEPLTYTFGATYSDDYVEKLLKEYALRKHHISSIGYANPQYDHIGILFLLDWVKSFPADLLIRVLGSIKQIAFTAWGFLKLHPIAIGHFYSTIFSVIAPFVVLVVTAFYNIRLAFFLIFFLVFIAGYPAIQFDPRHFFYLEFINLWCVGFLFQVIWMGLRQLKMYNIQTIQYLIQRSKIVILFFFSIFCIGFITLWGARIYQTHHLQQLFNSYLNAKTYSISTRDTVLEYGKTLIKLDFKNKNKGQYLKVQLAPDCTHSTADFTLRFNPLSTGNESGRFIVNNYKNATLFYPIYNTTALFKGLEIASSDRHCIRKIAVVADNPNITLWPVLWLPQGWENRTLYQQFDDTYTVIIPSNNAPLKLLDAKFDIESHEPITPTSKIFNPEKKEIHGYVLPNNKWGLLAKLPEKSLALHDMNKTFFYAEGTVKAGGLGIGLLDPITQLWEIVYNVEHKKFKVYIFPDNRKSYIPAIANNIQSFGWNLATVDTLGWHLQLNNP